MDANQQVETYETGATRSKETTFDPEGFINPAALVLYCEYMQRHRVQADGGLRDSDNWQKGMPTSRAIRSLLRHTLDAWLILRGHEPKSDDCVSLTDAVCGVLFNAFLILTNEVNNANS